MYPLSLWAAAKNRKDYNLLIKCFPTREPYLCTLALGSRCVIFFSFLMQPSLLLCLPPQNKPMETESSAAGIWRNGAWMRQLLLPVLSTPLPTLVLPRDRIKDAPLFWWVPHYIPVTDLHSSSQIKLRSLVGCSLQMLRFLTARHVGSIKGHKSSLNPFVVLPGAATVSRICLPPVFWGRHRWNAQLNSAF